MDGHGLLIAFDTEDREFARGFEAGRLWAMLRMQPDEPVEQVMLHATNTEMAIRVAEATERPFEAEDVGGDWISVSFGPARSECASDT